MLFYLAVQFSLHCHFSSACHQYKNNSLEETPILFTNEVFSNAFELEKMYHTENTFSV